MPMKTKTTANTSSFRDLLRIVLPAVLLFALAITCWCKPYTQYSESERRVLADMPAFGWQQVASGSFMAGFETYAQDQFPLRDSFRSLKALASRNIFHNLDNNGLYLAEGHLSKMEYPADPAMMQHAADRFRYLYDTYLADADANVYLAVVPDKNYYLAAANGRLALDYPAFIRDFHAMVGFAAPIHLAELLTLADFYTTDSHWRQEKIYHVAEALADAMNVPIAAEADYTARTLDTPFYGVYYGQAALPHAADSITYLISDVLAQCTLTSYDTGTPKEVPVYDLAAAAGRDPYEMFLSGSDAFLVLENPNALTDRELVVFRDSYASSLIPLLASGYSRITLVDIRYVPSGNLGNLLTVAEGADALFLYSTTMLNESLALR